MEFREGGVGIAQAFQEGGQPPPRGEVLGIEGDGLPVGCRGGTRMGVREVRRRVTSHTPHTPHTSPQFERLAQRAQGRRVRPKALGALGGGRGLVGAAVVAGEQEGKPAPGICAVDIHGEGAFEGSARRRNAAGLPQPPALGQQRLSVRRCCTHQWPPAGS